MSILFSRISNPFLSSKKSSKERQNRPRAGYIDPSVVKTWHWNYGGEFYVVKFRTDSMQIWVNDKEVAFQPSFAKNEGHIEFEADRQKCEIRVSVGKSGSSDCKKWRPNSASANDLEHGVLHHSKKKLVYKLFVEGISLGLPDSIEALMQRTVSAVGAHVQPLLPGARDEQRKALLSDTAANVVQTQAATEASSTTKRPQQRSQLGLTLMKPSIFTAQGDPCEFDESSMTGDLQSLLIA